jgi:hypothetical protein
MRRSLVALALVCVVGLVGCGDDDEESATTDTTTASTAPATPGRGGRFCELLLSYTDKYNRTRNVSDPEQLRDLLRTARTDVKEAQDVAPPDVKVESEIVAKVIDEYVEELEKVDFQTSRIPVATVQRLLSSDFLTAAQRIQEYGRTNC